MSILDCPLPHGWKRAPVSENYRITKKPRGRALDPNAYVPFIPMELVPAGGQADCGYELRRPAAIASGTYFEAGDVLLSKITPSFENGKQGVAINLPHAFGYGSTEIIPLQARTDDAINLYLFYLLLHHEVRSSLTSKMEGSTGRKRVPEAAVRELEIPVPPKPEQEKIAAILWKLQRAIATQDRLIAAAGDLKQSTMQRLFTHGLRGEALKDTEIGPMPESWDVTTLGAIATVSAGGTPSRSQPEYWKGGTIPWVKTGEVDYGVIEDTEEKITPLGLKSSAAKLLPKGTLLLAMYGQGITRGKVAMLGIDAATNQACAAVRPATDEVRTDFLFCTLAYGYERLRGLAHGGQQQNLNADLIRGFTLGVPQDPDEQRDIATALATIDRKLAHHRAKRAALDALFQTTLHQLMTAEVRVTDLDIDVSEVLHQLPDAGKMVDQETDATGVDHPVGANRMIGKPRGTQAVDHLAGVGKMVGSRRKR